jgi:hypothetical protein
LPAVEDYRNRRSHQRDRRKIFALGAAKMIGTGVGATGPSTTLRTGRSPLHVISKSPAVKYIGRIFQLARP